MNQKVTKLQKKVMATTIEPISTEPTIPSAFVMRQVPQNTDQPNPIEQPAMEMLKVFLDKYDTVDSEEMSVKRQEVLQKIKYLITEFVRIVAKNTGHDAEGLENVYKRHYEVAKHTREELRKMGLKTYAVREELNSPSVTGVYIPEGWTWNELDKALRAKGVFCGGTFGDLAGKIFRIGHMGSQATIENVDKCLNALREILATKH